jgi:hypothetical protein
MPAKRSSSGSSQLASYLDMCAMETECSEFRTGHLYNPEVAFHKADDKLNNGSRVLGSTRNSGVLIKQAVRHENNLAASAILQIWPTAQAICPSSQWFHR